MDRAMSGTLLSLDRRQAIKVDLLRGMRVKHGAAKHGVCTRVVAYINKMPSAILEAEHVPDPRVAIGSHRPRKLTVVNDSGETFHCTKLSVREMKVSVCAKRWTYATK